ncbi:hypothetical protein SAMN06265348_105177 [Pedobacter westerhofensis]|uniref:Lipoprotein n=1 Tax=Pedobacter westerhofensis TaxID=425512 RepID=A0A521DBM9_9SPHI|nr:hypothetical protein [Pedobacter westerhofensis]SMO69127.1 hypothetical protein SAMN06265348_105177 [Pedobacter westerhofensis]
MNKSILSIGMIAVFMAACQSKTPEEKIDSLAKSPDTVAAQSKACYAYIKNRDTVTLSYTIAGNNIAGEFSNNLFEKDKNSGQINGIIKGDTIIADYTAKGEGVTSVRQVAFLKKGDQLLEGYGDTREENGKMVFTKVHELKFVSAIGLTAVECK